MKIIKELFCFTAFAAVMTAFIVVSSCALTPKREDFGAMWPRFALEEPNSIEVMFFGSSLVYCNVIPAVFFENSGISSYIMAGPMQNMPTTYYYVRQMYETQSPELIVVEVSGMFFPEETDFNLINIGYMPYNRNRLGAVFHGAMKSERLGLLFPLYIYRDRWQELTRADFVPYTQDRLAGYTYLNHIMADAALEERDVLFSQENYNKNLKFLKKILTLAEEQESSVLLYINPSYRRINDIYLDMLTDDLKETNIEFIDFNTVFESIGIDPAEDFYDTAHFNFRGAEKFTVFLSQYILNHYEISKTSAVSLWEERVQYYRALVSE